MFGGMATAQFRTTFSLDAETARRLRSLALMWRVSQAEVVRRALAQAEATAKAGKPELLALLHFVHAQGAGLDYKTAEAYLAMVREDRKLWRGE